MANPNAGVYGAPETWDFSYINGGLTTDAAKALKIQKAKVPKWDYEGDAGYWTSQLRIGITAGNLTQNVPIDKTICGVGMGRDCPFATMGYFHRVVNEGTVGNVGLDSVVNVGNGVVNGFLWEMRDDASAGTYNLLSAGGGQIDEKQMTYRTWAPSSANERNTSRQNGNYFIAPYTYYQLKTFIASIQVYVCKSADIPENPEDITEVPQATWRSLDDWKNNYPTHKIIGLRLNFARANSILDSGGRITYTRPSPPSQYDYTVMCGFGILDELSFDQELQYKVYEYALFADGATWVTTIFKPFTDTAWNSSVHRIAFFGMFNVFSTYLKYLPGAVWYQIPYSEEIYDDICRAIATFGFIFVTDGTLTLPSAMNTDNICFPVISDEGIAHGDYTRGADNLTNDIYNADSTRDKNYDPIVPVDPNTYSDTTNWNTVNFQSAFCKRYELTAAQVGQLAAELWAAQATKPADIDYHNFAIDEYLTNNPIDTIVSLKYFPCDVETAANPAVVHLGKYQTNIAANAISHTIKAIDFEPIEVFPHFGDFRDYEPYTTLQMYIPFCGTVSIPTAEAMGKWVSVKLCIDINIGACAGYVIVSNSGSGGICVATATGTASIDIPVSGLQSANLSQAIFNATANWTQTQISNAKVTTGLLHHVGELSDNARLMSKGLAGNLGIGDISSGLIGTGGTGGVFSIGRTLSKLDPVQGMYNGMSMEIESSKSDYDLSHIMLPMRLIGSTSPALSSVIESSCRLIIYRPITDEGALSHYADTVGFATVSSGVVSEYSGYTEGTIDVSGINASATEKSEIQRLFASGVYL